MDGGIGRVLGASREGLTETGRLTIVGSGMKAVAHLTQEAIAHIRSADIVFFKVIEGVTPAFIRELNPNAVDLSQYYGDDKRRRLTYIQMAEVMVREVRAGRRVVGVFYGHPGFFVDPARRALAVAAREGYATEMLPGVSSTDAMFADLRIDPAQSGCQMLEATDLLLRRRPIVASGHVVILQIGSVGDAAYNFAHGFRNSKRAILFDHLLEIYGPNHPSVLYMASILPGVAPKLIRRKLGDYRDPAVLASIHPASTFYLPPKEQRATDPAMAELLGVKWVVAPGTVKPAPLAEYGPLEYEAVRLLEEHVPSPNYRMPLASPALMSVLTRLALNPDDAAAFARDPHGFVQQQPGLSPAEHAALLSRDAGRLTRVMMDGAPNPAQPKPVAVTATGSVPMSNTDIHVSEDVPMSNTDIHVSENVPMSNTDIHVSEDVPMSNTDIHVSENVPMSNTDIHVSEDVPMSNTDIHVTQDAWVYMSGASGPSRTGTGGSEAPIANSEVHVTEDVPMSDSEIHVTEDVPMSDSEIHVTEDIPMSNSEIHVTEDIPMSNSEIHVTEDIPMSNSEIHVTEEQTEEAPPEKE